MGFVRCAKCNGIMKIAPEIVKKYKLNLKNDVIQHTDCYGDSKNKEKA